MVNEFSVGLFLKPFRNIMVANQLVDDCLKNDVERIDNEIFALRSADVELIVFVKKGVAKVPQFQGGV